MYDPGPSAAAPLKVVVVDADERVRESLAGLLSIGDTVVVVGSAGDPATACDLVETTEPDVVVIDPRLPGVEGGLAFIERIRRDAPGVRVLVMGRSDALEYAALIRAADGVVRKTFRPTELVAAIMAMGSRIL
jgi:DNA-binding NarL/FixJ family response regulator